MNTDILKTRPEEAKGRKGDKFIGHLTPGEIVIPRPLAENDDFRAILAMSFKENGIDLEQFIVGSGKNKVNPETGKLEFFLGSGKPSGKPSIFFRAIIKGIEQTPEARKKFGFPATGPLTFSSVPPLPSPSPTPIPGHAEREAKKKVRKRARRSGRASTILSERMTARRTDILKTRLGD